MRSVIYRHDFSAAHRIPDHSRESKRIHGHNFKVEVVIDGDVDDSGMLIDFDVVKGLLGKWLDESWNNRILLCENDPILLNDGFYHVLEDTNSLNTLPYPPTVENMAKFLYEVFWQILSDNVILRSVAVYETESRGAICIP